jgi:hypothetical protein
MTPEEVLARSPRTLTQADMLEGLKKKSSKWIKGIAPNYRHFYWQRGYGAFSVSPSQLDALLSVFTIGLILGIIRSRSNTTTSAIVHGVYDFILVFTSAIMGQ